MKKIYTIKKLVNFSSEQIILFGLLDSLNDIKMDECQMNFVGESRYKNVIETCQRLFTYVDNINDCDIIVFPYKFKGSLDSTFKVLFNLAKKYNKVLYIFFNDDYDKQLILYSNNVEIYRTSFNKSTRLPNEFALPAFSPDYFDRNWINGPLLSIGYCGHKIHGREKYLRILEKSDIQTNFILRDGFWAPGIDKIVARKEYIENIDNNLFTFCYRGAGNFSYRLYDVMMMGRIPILITTDSVYPHENKYNLEDIGIVIDEKDLNENLFVERIKTYYKNNENRLINIQKQNRLLWETYFSPCGFLENLFL